MCYFMASPRYLFHGVSLSLCCLQSDSVCLCAPQDVPGCVVTNSNMDVVEHADIVLIATKPPVVPRVIQEVNAAIRPRNLLISIALGIPIRNLEQVNASNCTSRKETWSRMSRMTACAFQIISYHSHLQKIICENKPSRLNAVSQNTKRNFNLPMYCSHPKNRCGFSIAWRKWHPYVYRGSYRPREIWASFVKCQFSFCWQCLDLFFFYLWYVKWSFAPWSVSHMRYIGSTFCLEINLKKSCAFSIP